MAKYIFFILLIFLGILLLSLCFNPLKDGKMFQNFFKAIDFSVIELDIDKEEVRTKFQYYMPNSFEKLPEKILTHAVAYNIILQCGDVLR